MKKEIFLLALGSILLISSITPNAPLSPQLQEEELQETNDSSFSTTQLLQNDFLENMSLRTQTSRHWFNPAQNKYRYRSSELVWKENVVQGTSWVTYEEYPNQYIIRLRNGSIQTFANPEGIINYLALIDNSTIWGIGVESFSGVMGFYLNFQDTTNGHGQYLYYPRLKNGRLPAFNQPQYALYPHLFARVGAQWFDELLNNRSLYGVGNNPRNNLHFSNTSDTIEFYFNTNDITVQGFSWDFVHGLKWNRSTGLFHLITRFKCNDRGFDDIGMGYEITTSPQAENTPYEPEKFLIQNETYVIEVNVSQAWEAGNYLENFYSQVEIISENREGFTIDFSDMEEAGFSQKYLSLQDLEMPNFEVKKTLRAGMYGFGSYLQNQWIEIDPTYSEKQTIDEQDFQTRYVGSYILSTGMDHFRCGIRSGTDEYRGFITFNTSITDTISSIENANATIYVYDNYLGGSDSIYFGYYYNTSLYGGFWNETYGQNYDEDVHKQTTEWNDTWQIGSSGGNRSLPTTELGYLMDNWTVTHNVNPSERMYVSFKYWEGPGIVGDEWFRVYESTCGAASCRPTLEFDYTTGPIEPPEIDSPSDETYSYGFTNKNITWLPTERTNSPDKYVVYRNGSHYENGSWTNQTDIVIDIDSINTTVGAHNFTIIINDTSDLSANDTVWITVTTALPPEIDSPPDQEHEEGYSGQNITWTPTERTLPPDKYIVYRNGSHYENGSWSNQTPIVIDIDPINTMIGVHNFTIIINDTSNYDASDLVWINITETPPTTTTTTTTTTVPPSINVTVIVNCCDTTELDTSAYWEPYGMLGGFSIWLMQWGWVIVVGAILVIFLWKTLEKI